jgi:acylphosphatase
MPRLHFVVTGRVQGVAFRAHTRDRARQLGLAGFVENRADGAVAGEAEGADAALAAFVAWLHEGSPWSRVDAVTTSPRPPLGTEPSFEVRR